MEEKNSVLAQILYIVIFGMLAWITVMLLLRLRLFFLFIFIPALLIFGGIWIYRRVKKRRQDEMFNHSVEGATRKKIEFCKAETRKNRDEIREINRNVQELKSKLSRASDASSQTRKETLELIRALHEELNLREAKIKFLESCMRKLRGILHNHELAKTVQKQKEGLKLLREKNLDDIVNLEEFRADIEYDRTYLQTIDDLSTRLIGSQSLEYVRILQQELEEMTKGLNERD